jgi:hypothetical protein
MDDLAQDIELLPAPSDSARLAMSIVRMTPVQNPEFLSTVMVARC